MPSINLFAKKDKLKISHNSGPFADLLEGQTMSFDALDATHDLTVKFSATASSAEGDVNQCIFADCNPAENNKPCLSVVKVGTKTRRIFKAHPKTRRQNNDSESFKGVTRIRRLTGNVIRYKFGMVDLKFKT